MIAMALPYDPASQVTNILHQIVSSATQINQAAYAYNPVGNRTSLTDRRGSQAFGYDTLDRLTSASHPLLATPQAFAYDPVGNRTTGGSVVNAGNQLTADAIHSYQYDDNGNVTRKTFLATGNFTAYTYDAENRLTKVEDFVAGNPTPTATSTYRYDGLGRRTEKVANGQTRRYVYDGEDILLEYDGSNVLQARYTHGPGIDEPIAVTKAGATFFYHQDGLGTGTDLADSTGAMAKSYAYDAYGTIVDQTGTLEQPYTYTGREFDAETGLYYYRARYYDSASGRFLQKDPIGFLGGDLNTYSYVYQTPTFYNDPSGEVGLAGAGYGFIAGGTSAFIHSGGNWQAAAVGALAGAAVGAINPWSSSAVGSAVGGFAASVVGQAASNVAGCKKLTDIDYDLAAVAGLGGGAGRGLMNYLANPQRTAFMYQWNQAVGPLNPVAFDTSSALLRGAISGLAQLLYKGGPDSNSGQPCACP